MKITETAATAVLEAMRKKGLDPKKYYLEFAANQDGLTISFTDQRYGRVLSFGDLTVCVSPHVDSTGVVVDYGEINGRRGIIFQGEDNGNGTNKNS